MKKNDNLRKVIDFLKGEHSLTNEDLSLKLGYRTRSYVSDILGGNKEANRLFLQRLEEAYNINPEYVTGKSSDMNSRKNESNFSRETGKAAKDGSTQNHETLDNSSVLRILDNLSIAHKRSIDVIGVMADNEKSIIEKIPSSGFDPERLIDVEATVLGIREFVGKLYASVNKTSVEDALAQLGTYSVAARRRIGKNRNVSDESKSHKTG
jgi:hypothetical protein